MNPVKRILVVDDDPTILFLLEQLLATEGYEVVTASDGDEAHRLSRNQWFDLFLIDLIMPRKDGIETILSLRTFWRNTPIIAMSGSWQGGTRSCLSLAGKLGACGTLAKPFDRDTLFSTVRSLLESVPRKPHHGLPCNSLRRISVRAHWRREVMTEKARRWSNQFMASWESLKVDWRGFLRMRRQAVAACGAAAHDAQHKDGIAVAHAA